MGHLKKQNLLAMDAFICVVLCTESQFNPLSIILSNIKRETKGYCASLNSSKNAWAKQQELALITTEYVRFHSKCIYKYQEFRQKCSALLKRFNLYFLTSIPDHFIWKCLLPPEFCGLAVKTLFQADYMT